MDALGGGVPVTLKNFRFFKKLKQRPPEGYGMIYKITPKPGISSKDSTGYVGRTVQSLEDRLIQHVTKKVKVHTLMHAVRKHGVENFTVKIIEEDILEADLPEAEKRYVSKYDTLRRGYNETEGGETAPLVCPQIRKKHKAALQRPEVKANFKAAAKRRWEDPEYRANFQAGIANAYTPEVRARKSVVCKKQRQDPELEIQRGLAKRATSLRKRAEKRAMLPTEEERIKFDKKNAKSDWKCAKNGTSKTLQREFAAKGIDVMGERFEF